MDDKDGTWVGSADFVHLVTDLVSWGLPRQFAELLAEVCWDEQPDAAAKVRLWTAFEQLTPAELEQFVSAAAETHNAESETWFETLLGARAQWLQAPGWPESEREDREMPAEDAK